MAYEWFKDAKTERWGGEEIGYIVGYTQSQQDMIDDLEMHILINEHDWNRNPQAQFRDFIESLNK